MKVSELIEQLNKLDQEKEVWCIGALQGDWEYTPVTKIYIDILDQNPQNLETSQEIYLIE